MDNEKEQTMTDNKMGNVIGAMEIKVNDMFMTPESTQDLFGHPMFKGNPDCITAAMMTWNLIASKQKSNSKEIAEIEDDPSPLKAMEDGINDAIEVGEMSKWHPNIKIYRRAYAFGMEIFKEQMKSEGKEIVNRMENIVCLDCDNTKGGDEPWGNFDRDDSTKLYSCNECKSKNIGFVTDIKFDEDADDWIEEEYREQLSSEVVA